MDSALTLAIAREEAKRAAGARSVAGALYQAGFTNTRAVFQLWTPNFRPSQARLGGKPLEMFLVSTMQMHTQTAYDAIRDAWEHDGSAVLDFRVEREANVFPLVPPGSSIGEMITREGVTA